LAFARKCTTPPPKPVQLIVQIAEFLRRGWSEVDIAGLIGGNLLRVLRAVEGVKEQMSSLPPSSAIYGTRKDLPAINWGGPGGAYLPPGVKQIVGQGRVRDEL
jgi:membrane dipeptidase